MIKLIGINCLNVCSENVHLKQFLLIFFLLKAKYFGKLTSGYNFCYKTTFLGCTIRGIFVYKMSLGTDIECELLVVELASLVGI